MEGWLTWRGPDDWDAARFGACSELWQLPVSRPFSPQPPVTPTIRRTSLGSEEKMSAQFIDPVESAPNPAWTRPSEGHRDHSGTAASRRARFQAVCVAWSWFY